MSNSRLDEIYEENNDKKLAELLGISYDELCQLNFEPDSDCSEEGLVYGHYVQFRADSPNVILKKIKGLDESRTFYFEPGAFADDFEDQSDEFEGE